MLGIFIVLFILSGIAFLAIGFVIFRVVTKSLRRRTPEEMAGLRMKAEVSVREKRAELVSWNDDRLDELSLGLNYFALKGITRSLKGTMAAMNGERLIAFSRFEYGTGSTGFVCAASTEFDLFIETTPEGIYTIQRNGQPMGRWDMLSGSVTDASGKVIGTAVHPPLKSYTVTFGRRKVFTDHTGLYRGGTAYTWREGKPVFPVVLNGREIAEMRVAPAKTMEIKNYDVEFNQENPEDSRILELKDAPSETEKQWLVALCVIEAVVHGHWLV